jgi:hypothetical protein
MRIQNEQSGSSSLFAQPMALEAVPEAEPVLKEHGFSRADHEANETGALAPGAKPIKTPRNILESRMEAVLVELSAAHEQPSVVERQGHLALLKRWYYRPEAKRPGEIFFPSVDGAWPIKAMLRGVGRVAAKTLTAANRAE